MSQIHFYHLKQLSELQYPYSQEVLIALHLIQELQYNQIRIFLIEVCSQRIKIVKVLCMYRH